MVFVCRKSFFLNETEAVKLAMAMSQEPLATPRNLALKVRPGATYAFHFSPADTFIDRVVSGYPENPQHEWTAQGEKHSAARRLSWDNPAEINRIWLFDRPNTSFIQVLSGLLVFSDGATLPVGALPDDGKSRLEVSFPSKTVNWLFFLITGVKAETHNNGLAEIAVFGPEVP